MNANWPWGNYWEWPDEDAFARQPEQVPSVDWSDPEPPPLLGPDGEPLLPPRPPVGFALPARPSSGLETT